MEVTRLRLMGWDGGGRRLCGYRFFLVGSLPFASATNISGSRDQQGYLFTGVTENVTFSLPCSFFAFLSASS
jgi:hypothetical protein